MAPAPYRFAYLLAAQVGLIVVYPFLAGDQQSPGLSGAFTLAVLAGALWAVGGGRQVRVVAGVLAAPAIAGDLLAALFPGTSWLVPGILFGMVFLAYVTAVIFRNVVLSPVVTTATLYGAVTTYLLVGLTWAWAYALVERFQPGSFRSLVTPDRPVAGPEFTYLSFITLTSVGYGDIVPLGGHARSLAVVEAITGQMYLAVFVTRLVGLYGQSREPA